jgi:hypothetical protein
MANLSRLVGMMLIILGVASYVMTDRASVTALIPAAFGLAISICGFFARDEATRKTAMHVAMGVALVGILGSISGLMALPALLSGGEVARPAAAISRSIMAVVLIAYLAAGIKSFRAASQRR